MIMIAAMADVPGYLLVEQSTRYSTTGKYNYRRQSEVHSVLPFVTIKSTVLFSLGERRE